MNGVAYSQTGFEASDYNYMLAQVYNFPVYSLMEWRKIGFQIRGYSGHKFYATLQLSNTGIDGDFYDYTSLFHDGYNFANYYMEFEIVSPYVRIQIRWFDGGGNVYVDTFRRN